MGAPSLSLSLSSSLFPPLSLSSLSDEGIFYISPDKATGGRRKGRERRPSDTSIEAAEGAEEADGAGGGGSGSGSGSRRGGRCGGDGEGRHSRILLIK